MFKVNTMGSSSSDAAVSTTGVINTISSSITQSVSQQKGESILWN